MKYWVRVREYPKESLIYKDFQKNEELFGMVGRLTNDTQYIYIERTKTRPLAKQETHKWSKIAKACKRGYEKSLSQPMAERHRKRKMARDKEKGTNWGSTDVIN